MATITQTNGKTWKAIVRKARFGVRLKVKTFSRKSDAEAWARKTESEIERGVWRDVGGADRMTLGEALDKYEKEVVSNHRVATASVERAILSRVTSLRAQSAVPIGTPASVLGDPVGLNR